MKKFLIFPLAALLLFLLVGCNSPQQALAQLCADQPGGCPEVTISADADYTARFVTVPCVRPSLMGGTIPAGTKVLLEGLYTLQGKEYAKVVLMENDQEVDVLVIEAKNLDLGSFVRPKHIPELCSPLTL